jgi:hypothetical protein
MNGGKKYKRQTIVDKNIYTTKNHFAIELHEPLYKSKIKSGAPGGSPFPEIRSIIL